MLVPKPKFSIITCTWNSAATLADTIASVRSQAYADVEHIFVDGGSTDGTLDLIANCAGNIKVVHAVRGGISKAMNAGIAAATGNVIAHLHSDDYYLGPNVLDAVAESLQLTQRKWLFGKIRVLKDGALVEKDYQMRKFSLSSYAAGRVFVPHPAVFICKSVFPEVGLFDERLKYAMDIDLWLRLGARYAPAQINAPLTVFRDHAGSLSSANRRKAREEEMKVRWAHARHTPIATSFFWLRHLKRMQHLPKDAGLEMANPLSSDNKLV